MIRLSRPRPVPLALCAISLTGLLIAADEYSTAPKAGCVAGCAAAKPSVPELAGSEIARCLEGMALQPVGESSIELETLLFHAGQVIPYLQAFGEGPLKSEQSRFLKRELARGHARIQLRVVDAAGKERMCFDRQVPIGIKQHLHSEAADGFTPPEIGFTVQRVGLRHLWTRL